MKEGNNTSNRILTIPNLLSMLRICMIPALVWLYLVKEDPIATTLMLTLSGATDVVDGFIARKFNMISNLGKALDPVADKLTQAAMLFCLVTRFPYMWAPLGLMIVKEIFMGVTGLMAIIRSKSVEGADWHGKVNTVLLYTVMVIHLLWFDIPAAASNLLIAASTVMMLVSLVLYGMRHIHTIRHPEEHRE